MLDHETRTYRSRGGVAVTTLEVEEVEWFDADADGVIDHGEELIEVSRNYFHRPPRAIVVEDVNPLDGSSGIKVYARGVGLVADGPLRLLRVTELDS